MLGTVSSLLRAHDAGRALWKWFFSLKLEGEKQTFRIGDNVSIFSPAWVIFIYRYDHKIRFLIFWWRTGPWKQLCQGLTSQNAAWVTADSDSRLVLLLDACQPFPQISVILENDNWHLIHIFLSTQRTKFWGFKDKKTCFLPTRGKKIVQESRTTDEQGSGPSWGWNNKSELAPIGLATWCSLLTASSPGQVPDERNNYTYAGKRSQEDYRKLCWRIF